MIRILDNPYKTHISIGVVAFTVGIGIGFVIGRRKKVEVYEIPNQIEFDFNVDALPLKKEDKISHTLKKEDKTSHNEKKVSIHKEIDKILLGDETVKKEIEIMTSSVFADNTEDWNYEEELKKRTPYAPYIIHKDEFYSEEAGYTQSTLVYYAGDDIMADEDETPVFNHESVTGSLWFGHGSGDKNVVYVRNDKRKAEYEILFDPGLFSVDVLGLEIENNQRVKAVKHSAPKFRMKD